MIYNYSNFQNFLESEITSRQSKNILFSAHSFAKKIGITQSYLSLLINGKRKPTTKLADKLSNYLQLSTSEKTYLNFLIQLTRDPKVNERKRILEDMTELKRKHICYKNKNFIKELRPYHFYLILMLGDFTKDKINLDFISKYLELPASKVKKSLNILKKLKLISQVDDHYITLRNNFSLIPQYIVKTALRKIAREYLFKFIEEVKRSERSFDLLEAQFIPTDEKQIKKAKKMIFEFNQKLRDTLEASVEKNTIVYHNSIFNKVR